MNYPMLHVSYDEDNAGAAVGVPFSGNLDPNGDNIGASETTMGKLYLMPDAASDPKNCIGFVTVLDVQTYKWCNVGAIRIPSDVLAKTDVDNECTNGTVDTPASAKAVMELKSKLGSIDLTETKVAVETDGAGQNVTSGYFVDGSTGENTRPSSSSDYQYYDVFETLLQEGIKSVRFCAGGRKNSTYSSGYAFGKYVSDTWIPIVYGYFPVSDYESDMLLPVPDDATHFRTTCKAKSSVVQMDLDKFYCYLQEGSMAASERQVEELESRVFGNEDIKVVSDNILVAGNDYFYGLQQACFRHKEDAGGPNGACKYLTADNVNYLSRDLTELRNSGKKLLITKSSGICHVTFRTSVPMNNLPTSLTLNDMISAGVLSQRHNNDGSWDAVIDVIGEEEFDIPDDAKYVAFTKYWYDKTTENHLPDSVKIVEYKKPLEQRIPEVVDSLDDESTTNALSANQGKVLNEHISEIDSRFISEERVDLAGQRKVLYYAAASTGLWTAGVNPVAHIALPVNPGDVFNVIANNIRSTTYAFFTDEYDEIYSGEAAPVLGEAAPIVNGTEMYVLPKNNETRITVPDGTKYLYILYGNIKGNGAYIPKSITAITIKTIKEQATISNDSFAGYISDTGEFISSKNYLTTKQYSGSFNIRLMKGYKIVRVVLYDANNNVVNYNFIGSEPGRVMFSAFSYDDENYASLEKNDCRRTEFGLMYMPEGFYVRIVIAKEDGSVINTGEAVIKSFYDLNCGSYKNELDLKQDSIKAAVRRAINITSLYYYCLGKFPVKDSKYKDLFEANTVCCGVPYSLPREKNGLVGYGCNIKNFITAIQNPRSVMYTENIKNGTSEYEIQYTDYSGITSHSATYFGAVCSSLVNYIYGIRLSYQCQSMGVHTDEYEYLDREENYNIYNMPPLTAIQTPLHVFVILDFLTDKYGNRKFAIVAEETTPTATLYVYSVETLQFRLDYLDRYYELNNPTQGVRYLIPKDGLLESTKNNFEGSLYSFDTNDYRKSIPEIMTFAGDYASFPIGQTPIFINALPSDKYNKLDLYYKAPNANDYSLLTSIDISDYTPDETGMIDVDVTNFITSGGLYRARLSNTSDSSISYYTHFEAVKLMASVDNVTTSRKEINITEYEGATLFGKLFVFYWIPASDTKSSEFSNAKDGFGYISQDEIDNNKIIINTSGFQYNLANSKVCVIMQGEYNQVQFSYDIPPLNN
jgi:hypothetical protein